MIELILGLVASYTCGAIPFGILITRLAKGVDVRDFGSGSTGFTNVYRVAGPFPAGIVALFDIGKGLASTAFIAPALFSGNMPIGEIQFQVVCGCAAVVGHIYTVFAGFKGGKGVLTALGVCVALLPVEVAVAVAVFGVVFFVTRYISAGSLIASASLPITLLVEKYALGKQVDSTLLFFTFALFAVIAYAHRQNIIRLVRGKENKFKRVDVR
jgi:glycerol-3-phosphate acyltransferase PlsY